MNKLLKQKAMFADMKQLGAIDDAKKDLKIDEFP